MNRKDFEIMAPAGSFESLMAAIQGGADSVYFGAGNLNMRSRSSSNFSAADLKYIADKCREHGIKSYLTLNITLYDNDLEEMRRMVDVAVESNISAIIASDIAAIQYARSKGMEVHISTQSNVSNIEAVKFYSNFADVVVLARELNMDQVRAIHEAIVRDDVRGPAGDLVRIEMFAHGALCMAVSGKCYLSLHQMNASANRGACLQPCRRSYIVSEKETGNELAVDNEYIMSPKDLKTIHFLNKMIDAGVRVFKIEGRARGPEYVKRVCSTYNDAINAYLEGKFTTESVAKWNVQLSSVFNRGFWDGYYLGQRLGEWSSNYGSQATKKKLYIGKGTNYFPKIGVAEFLMETHDLKVGDEILITGPTTGVIELKVAELRYNLEPVEEVKKGQSFSIATGVKIRRNDKLYKMIDSKEK